MASEFAEPFSWAGINFRGWAHCVSWTVLAESVAEYAFPDSVGRIIQTLGAGHHEGISRNVVFGEGDISRGQLNRLVQNTSEALDQFVALIETAKINVTLGTLVYPIMDWALPNMRLVEFYLTGHKQWFKNRGIVFWCVPYMARFSQYLI